jgi:hypothetical protein
MRAKLAGPLLFTLVLFVTFNTNATLLETDADQAKQWLFKVFLDDREIGFHDYRVVHKDGRTRVETSADFDVKVLFVNLYRYRHRNVETWDDNCLVDIDASTDANGKDFTVKGASGDDRLVVSSGLSEVSLTGCVMTFAYWNPEFLGSDQLLNAQTGEMESTSIVFAGEENLSIQGASIKARRYVVNTKRGPITLWYSADDLRWLALESFAKGGRKIRYEPQVIPGGLPQILKQALVSS